jgi:hypothetical protein
MEDREIEQLLRQYRPVGPRPELRARILSSLPARRTWPWMTAAAALLLVAVVLRDATGRSTPPKAFIDSGRISSTIPAETLADVFGGGTTARELAQFILLRDAELREQGESSAAGVLTWTDDEHPGQR